MRSKAHLRVSSVSSTKNVSERQNQSIREKKKREIVQLHEEERGHKPSKEGIVRKRSSRYSAEKGIMSMHNQEKTKT